MVAEPENPVLITPASFPEDREAVATLFTEYANTLAIDLSFQNFSEELEALPGKYAADQGGCLFLARRTGSDSAIGCVALRPTSPPDTCEIKRLYVRSEGRGMSIGKTLLERVIAEAKKLGYKEMLLDTLPGMSEARRLYTKFGFTEAEKYYNSPIEGTIFQRLVLTSLKS
ncbi:hypothetical protein V5O48_008284 [Marasmius crinis-equi]|uniref:N-acetyltransferase domain-containing protein n=1 Tax=Marasmius crinis-equi TaxID=585013 RepID=A0ABR3FEU4_9AGAR